MRNTLKVFFGHLHSLISTLTTTEGNCAYVEAMLASTRLCNNHTIMYGARARNSPNSGRSCPRCSYYTNTHSHSILRRTIGRHKSQFDKRAQMGTPHWLHHSSGLMLGSLFQETRGGNYIPHIRMSKCPAQSQACN